MAGFSKELESMEKVLQVYEELDGDNTKGLEDVVTPYRLFQRTMQLAYREAPFSTNKKIPMRGYLFRDLLLLAKTSSGPMSKVGSRLSDSFQSQKRTQHKTWKSKYKLFRRLDLDKVSNVTAVEKMDTDKTYGVQLTYVTRTRERKVGTSKVITKIEKLEFWFPTKQAATDMQQELTDYVDEIMEAELHRRESSMTESSAGVSVPGQPVEKKRSWASRKGTLKRAGTLSRKGSGSTAGGDSVGGLSLADLEGRYHVDTGGKDDNGKGEKVEFLVEFGEGPMGFSLGSGAGVGVIVGRLAPNSFSEIAGVCIGDRVVSIDEKEIGLNSSWQEAVEIIKTSPRPITLKFERIAGRVVQEPEADPGAKSAEGGGHARTTSQKKRAWAAKRAARGTDSGGGDRLISLNELEKMYQTTETTGTAPESIIAVFDKVPSKSEHESKCISVLKEIIQTERDYVQDLRTLVGEYILPLRRTMRRQKCRDVENGSKICEHSLLRSTCSRTASKANQILDSDEISAIFMNVETLVKINTELLNVLQTGLADVAKKEKVPTLRAIAAVYAHAFVRVMPFFKMYAHYCHQYPMAIDRLQITRAKSPELHAFLKAREERSSKTSLNSLLIKPVQRICKYPLLFRELLKHMVEMSMKNFNEYIQELEEAASAVEQIASSVNKKVGEKESMDSLMEVYEELGGEEGVPGLITAHRRYLKTEDVLMREAPFSRNEKKRYLVYIFNDLMLFARGTGATWGTLTKAGTANRSSTGRSLSLRKAFTRSGSGTSGRLSSSRQSGTLKNKMKVTKWVELRSCTVKKVVGADPNGCHAIEVKYVEREVAPTSNGKGTLGRKSNSNAGSGKVVTSVLKYELWSATEANRDMLFTTLQDCLSRIEDLESGHKQAQHSVGAPRQMRGWMRKRDSNASGTSGGSDLADLASKYGRG